MTDRSPIRTAVIALAAAAGLAVAGLAGPAAAQNSGNQQSAQQSGQQSGQQSQQQSTNYSDAKLESFALAAAKVRTVMEEYRPQLRQARQNQDRAQFEKVRTQARKAVEQKISDTQGISSQEYQQIAQDARNDEQLRQKVLGMMKSQQQQSQ